MQRTFPLVYLNLVRSSQFRAVRVILSTSKSRRLGCCNSGDVLDQKTTPTQYICWCLSFHDVWINLLGFIVGLISCCCSQRRRSRDRSAWSGWQCLFQRPAFPQYCLNFADDALQVTSPKAPFCVENFFLEAPSLQPGRERYTATTLWCSMSKAIRSWSSHVTKFLRNLLASVATKKNNEPKQTDQIFKSSTKFANLVAKARWSVRRKGDWKEIAKLKAKYSILGLPLPACAAAVSFVAMLFAGVDLQSSDRRGVSWLPICADTLFFLLNECSLSQNECLWPLQTNFYRTFGRFVSALIKTLNRVTVHF